MPDSVPGHCDVCKVRQRRKADAEKEDDATAVSRASEQEPPAEGFLDEVADEAQPSHTAEHDAVDLERLRRENREVGAEHLATGMIWSACS